MSTALMWSYITFATFTALLLYRTSLALINPFLLILGYHVFSVEIRGQGEAYIIAKRSPSPTKKTYTKRIVNGLFITADDPHPKITN